MKTNSKEVKKAIQGYIIYNLDDEVQGNLKDKLKNCIDCFHSEHYCKYEQKRQPNTYLAFWDYLMGLPSCLSVTYWHDEMRELIAEWLKQSPEQAAKYPDEKVQETFRYLILREFAALLKNHDLEL